MASFVDTLRRHRATAILRCDDADRAAAAMDAAVAGGFRIVEVTLTTPGAYDLITALARRRDLAESGGLDHLIVGAGTVLTPKQAERAAQAGAQFLVSPITDPAVIEAAARLGVAAMPGAHTPTEMVAAHRAGAPLVKLFPAPAGGPAYLRSIRGPLPFLRIVPTAGVDEANAADWLEAGAWALGFVASLFDPHDLARGDMDAIEARARRIRAVVDGARASAKLGSDPFK
jgi:2-dehydro-3-deoxyphosphogluconate aldolase/(4S)-4-hydroxy-2-oxoglutarate aldolase